MRHAFAALVALAVSWAGGTACAMTANPVKNADCVVLNGDKLPAETGGPDAVCEAIKQALLASGFDRPVKVEIRVKSNAWLVARIIRDGVALPEQNMAVADGKLQRGSVDRFARAIAQAVSTAG